MKGRDLAGRLFPVSISAKLRSSGVEYRLTSISPSMSVGVGTAIAVALRLYIFDRRAGVPLKMKVALREVSRSAIVAS